MSKHSKSPWRRVDHQSMDIVDADGEVVSEVRTYGQSFRQDEPSANANLLASAPEMYEALKGVIEWYDDHSGCYDPDVVVQAARAAVRKANGFA